ncbi:MAG: CU044_5270 family protein [Streptosporangiaceae bacterium]|jgi:hypothetical protein
MEIDTLITAADPARRVLLDDPGSAEATRLYQRITSTPDTGRHATRPRRRRRIILPVVAGAAAAGLAAGLIIAAQPGARPAPAVGVENAQLTARQVLDNAATAALARPDVTPRSDQFFYVKLKITGSGSSDGISQYWLSIDGERNGLQEVGSSGSSVQPGCVDGRTKVDTAAKGPGYQGPSSVSCTAIPAYLPDLPTSPGALLSYLERTQGVGLGKPGLPANALINSLGKEVDALFTSDWLSPAQQAALYRLVAQTPGTTLVRHVTDVDGRPGVGVQWIYQGLATVLIFDAKTYAYLGSTEQDGDGTDSGGALLKTGVVNQVSELP